MINFGLKTFNETIKHSIIIYWLFHEIRLHLSFIGIPFIWLIEFCECLGITRYTFRITYIWKINSIWLPFRNQSLFHEAITIICHLKSFPYYRFYILKLILFMDKQKLCSFATLHKFLFYHCLRSLSLWFDCMTNQLVVVSFDLLRRTPDFIRLIKFYDFVKQLRVSLVRHNMMYTGNQRRYKCNLLIKTTEKLSTHNWRSRHETCLRRFYR